MTQDEALAILKMGVSVFLTGAPGTGKTFILNEYIKYLKSHGVYPAITASTGIASTHINGKTIHAWSGIQVYDHLDDWLLDKLDQNEKLYKRYNEAKVLIIDEISMLHASRLEMIDKLARRFRRNDSPFGGLQVIFTGDFFQLPPVVKGFNEQNTAQDNEFAYNSKAWRELNPVVCYLEKNYRQEDEQLAKLLNDIRENQDREEIRKILQTNPKSKITDNLKLYTHNIDVDGINLQKYLELVSDEEHDYVMSTHGNQKLLEGMKKNLLAKETLSLKIGAKVIFIKNDKNGQYQNGTLGTVINFENNLPQVKTQTGQIINVSEETWSLTDDDGKVIAEISQLPLNYAWAITVHKSQGMTLDSAEIDLSKAFGTGMGYVALSRIKSLRDLNLLGLNASALQVNENVQLRNREFKKRSEQAKLSLSKYLEKDKPKPELLKKWEEFILACGGELREQEVADETYEEKKPTTMFTLEFVKNKIPLEEIAKVRDLKLPTIINHLEKLLSEKMLTLKELEYILKVYQKPYSKKELSTIETILKHSEKLKPAHEKLNHDLKIKIDYDTLKILSLALDRD